MCAKFCTLSCIKVITHKDTISYVCNATGKINGDCVCATAEGISLSEAENIAKTKLTNLILEIRECKKIVSEDPFVPRQDITINLKGKDHLNGGGSKKISPGQINLINKLAFEHGMIAEAIVRNMYRKPIEKLIGSEANAVIKYMKNKG